MSIEIGEMMRTKNILAHFGIAYFGSWLK